MLYTPKAPSVFVLPSRAIHLVAVQIAYGPHLTPRAKQDPSVSVARLVARSTAQLKVAGSIPDNGRQQRWGCKKLLTRAVLLESTVIAVCRDIRARSITPRRANVSAVLPSDVAHGLCLHDVKSQPTLTKTRFRFSRSFLLENQNVCGSRRVLI